MKLLDKQDNILGESVDLGVVEAGKSKEFEYFLYNDDADEVTEITVEFKSSEIEVLVVPKTLGAKGKEVLKIKWSPSLTVKKGLKSEFKIKATELYK